MITGEIKNKVDKIWESMWTGGISNPLTVIEQLTYLLFIKGLDETQKRLEKSAELSRKKLDKSFFSDDQQELRWSIFKNKPAEEMYEIVSQKVFPYLKTMGDMNEKKQENNKDNEENNSNKNDKDDKEVKEKIKETVLSKHLKTANFMIPTPNLLSDIVDKLDKIPMEDRDSKGDLYEYLLDKLSISGTNGQFRTPRHIIKMMVDLVQPKPDDKIADSASGTCGFLIAAAEYILKNYEYKLHDDIFRNYYNKEMFHGNDFDATMIRIGAMNMLLHGIEEPQLTDLNALTQLSVRDEYTIILANPPFKGSLNKKEVKDDIIKMADSSKTEILFLGLFLKQLKAGGRAAIIVPDGVLFGSSRAHKQIRKTLVEDHRLQAVISMPSGVFKPYAGVSTAVLIFTRTDSGGTDNVWFYDMQADGLSLDDKRTPLNKDKHEENNIPDIINRFTKEFDKEESRKRTDQSFLVPKEEIAENDYDLSINRYKEIEYEEVEYDPVNVILDRVEKREEEIVGNIKALKSMLQDKVEV